MNLLLHPDPFICEKFISLLGVAAGLATVDDDGGFTLLANNELAREFYLMQPLDRPRKLNVENVAPLLDGNRDPAEVRAYVDRMRGNYQAVATSGETLTTETDVQLPSGVIRWGRNTLTPVNDAEGRVARILVTFVDVTELRDAEAELEDSLTAVISRVVTVCEGCNKVADGNDWLTMPEYMERHSEVQFSHGICQRCLGRYFGDRKP